MCFLWQSYTLVRSATLFFKDGTPKCIFCKRARETYVHLFWQCPKVRYLWAWFTLLCEDFYGVEDSEEFSRTNCLLSNFKLDILIWISVIIKQRIWYFRCKEGFPPTWESVLMKIERAISFCSAKDKSRAGKKDYFQKVWGLWVTPTIREEIEALMYTNRGGIGGRGVGGV